MGKRKQERGNIENIEPQELFSTETSTSPLSNSCEMKTRSKKAKPAESSPVHETGVYPSSVILYDIAHDVSTTDVVVETEVPYELPAASKSPLSECSINELTPERTPEKETDSPLIVSHVTSLATRATPTANLKILCEAVDHDETVSSESSIIRTPTGGEPVTPTTNLKMLITAASPEIRSLEMSKSRLFTDEDEEEDQFEEVDTTKKSSKAAASATRKQKSLGILCRRFMSEFDENPPKTSRIEVCLDELATHLGTERRRIYDIVNVLESVEMMSRRAKNRYLWHGKTNLNATLVKLKYFAETEKVAKQLELVRELEVARLYGRKTTESGRIQTEDEAVLEHPKYKQYMQQFGEAHRKEKSLGVMSQKFLMLFLTGRTKTINLDMAAKILLGDPMVETKQTNAQFKTKIRRLYDIANILASVNLVCKVHVTELRGRKPAFSYVGPDVEELASLDEYQYLKGAEVARPGRTTLDMKMEELKRKMDAHIAAEQSAAAVIQVPPVTVQAPDLEEIKLSMTPGNNDNLSRLAAEHAAAKRDKQRVLAPAPAVTTQRPFLVIQGLSGGSTSVVKTTQAPNFMDGQQSGNSIGRKDDCTTISLVSVIDSEGKQFLLTGPVQQLPTAASLLNPLVAASSVNSPTAGSIRQALSHSATKQTLTLYSPPVKESQTTVQPKRIISEVAGVTGTLVARDGPYSTIYLTKTDDVVSSKKAKLDDGTGRDNTSDSAGVGSEEALAGSSQPQLVYSTPITSHMSSIPVPVVYSTPSEQHVSSAAGNDVNKSQVITGTQLSFMASPDSTPAGTPVSTTVTSSAASAADTSKSNTAIRQLLLSPK